MLNTARIAKSTIFLYVRMILVLAANFLAVRVLLEVLGVEDYGLFNLIVGFVTLFTLLNGAMMSTVQRFLCFELGKKETSNSTVDLLSPPTLSSPSSTRLIFTLCFWLFVALAALIVIVSETGGLWFVYHKLNIPPARFHSAQIVYQLSIVVMVFKTLQIPYTALIVSYERMNAFAKISIVEAVLTLAAAFALKFLPPSTSTSFLHLDLLVVYSVLYTISQGVVCLTYALYCRHHFDEAHLLSLFRSRSSSTSTSSLHLLKSLSGFFSWSILGAIANMLKQQGLNVLLNIFFGVAFNATWAVANKIGMAVNQLVGNFQQAFNPQIVKLYAEPDRRPYFVLVSNVVMSLACHVFRVLHLSRRTGFPVLAYIRRAMLPICLVAALSVAFIALERRALPALQTLPLLELVLVTLVNLLIMLFVGCTSSERTFLYQKLAAKLHRKGNS